MITTILVVAIATGSPVYAYTGNDVLSKHTERMATLSDKTETKLKELFKDLKMPWGELKIHVTDNIRKDMEKNEVKTLLDIGIAFDAHKMTQEDYMKYNKYLLSSEKEFKEFQFDKGNEYWWNWLKQRWKDGKLNER